MASDLSVALLLLVLFLGPSSPAAVHVHAAAADLGEDGGGYMLVPVSSLKPEAACFGHRVIPPAHPTWTAVGFGHGPCSPSNATAPPSLSDLLRRDQLRADDVQKRLSNNGTGDDKAPAMAGGGGEIDVHSGSQMQVSMGSRSPAAMPSSAMASTHPIPFPFVSSIDPEAAVPVPAAGGSPSSPSPLPGVIQTVVLDTASDVAWVQCVPCPVPPCHPQTDPVYDPTTSPTYAAFSCGSPACRQLGPYANGCVNNQCQYRVAYPDGSSTSGTYSSDLLTLNPTTSVNSFQFGCTHADSGFGGARTAGIMALGGGPESLVSQTAAMFGRAFSYCLPPSASYLGFFVLGARPLAAVSSSRDMRAPATFYRVLLRAITVGGQRLAVPATVFAAGTVLDSRTLITRLPPTAYQALRAAFASGMRAYRAAPPRGGLDTCYDFTGVGHVKLPKIALVFDGGATVELDPSGVLFDGCLAFASNGDDRRPGILGSVQQQTIEVLYDVSRGAIGFRTQAC
ncbi:hypothetical protein U9M48_030027 [Paspalum notatum var. saurae]|uniref:Peptidase A1 domain-containing protein n=1 Tax=Paspalum notatum var. saurae TaxID=547442 RepID=A0AAQ3U2U6_PASNO